MCKELFASLTSDTSVREVEAQCPGCLCEADSVSDYSPGKVTDNETVCRLIFSPLHIDDKTGDPLPGLFDDAFKWGASVLRAMFAAAGEIDTRGEEKAAADVANGKERLYIGYCSASVDEIRGCLRDRHPERLICVYDTATPENSLHADVFAFDKASRTVRQEMKIALHDLFCRSVTRVQA